MPNLIKKLNISKSDILFLVFAVLICFYVIFMSPMMGVADQGDFERVMQVSGLDYIDKQAHSFYEYVEPLYRIVMINPLFVLGIIPATSYIYPIIIAKLISRIFLLDYFDTRILAVVMCVIFISVCFFIVRQLRFNNKYIKYLFYALFLFVFFDGVNLTMFNSMYGQSMLIISLAMFILSCVLILNNWDTIKKRHLIFLLISSIFLIGAKLQCIVLLPFIFAVFLYIRKKNIRYNKLIIYFLCILTWYGVGNYVIHGHGLNRDTQYNSVFYGILKDSENPEQDLIDLGLSPDLAQDSGKHAYLPIEEYVYPPRTLIMEQEFYDKMNNIKLMSFYISHPKRLIQAMETTANNSFYTFIDLGTYEKSTGFPPSTSEYRFSAWSTIRSHFPKTLFFIIPMYIVFFASSLMEYRKTKSRYILLYWIVLGMGLIQFPMPYLGNGNADIVKQLYLFNITFDIGLLTTLWLAERNLFLWIEKKKSSNI